MFLSFYIENDDGFEFYIEVEVCAVGGGDDPIDITDTWFSLISSYDENDTEYETTFKELPKEFQEKILQHIYDTM